MTTLMPPDVIRLWQQSPVSVQQERTHSAAVTTFHDLAHPAVITPLIHHIQQHGTLTQRTATLTIVHYMVGALTTLLTLPYAATGSFFDVTAHDIGMYFDTNGMVTQFWLTPSVTIHTKQPLPTLVRKLQTLIMPVFTLICRHASLPVRGSQIVMYDALRQHTRLALQKAHLADPVWIASLLEALGDTGTPPLVTFAVQPDTGPVMQWEQPRVCCVLAKTTDDHSCPHCPKHALAHRIDATEAWLRSMSDTDFHHHTGRARL